MLLQDATRHHEPLKDGIIADPRDSYAWLSHPMYVAGVLRAPVRQLYGCCSGVNPWFIKMTYDACTIYCPIGFARHNLKIEFVYYTLLNLSMRHRHTPLTNLQLVSMCLVSVLVDYGPCAIISGVRLEDGSWPDDSSAGGQLRRGYAGEISGKQVNAITWNDRCHLT